MRTSLVVALAALSLSGAAIQADQANALVRDFCHGEIDPAVAHKGLPPGQFIHWGFDIYCSSRPGYYWKIDGWMLVRRQRAQAYRKCVKRGRRGKCIKRSKKRFYRWTWKGTKWKLADPGFKTPKGGLLVGPVGRKWESRWHCNRFMNMKERYQKLGGKYKKFRARAIVKAVALAGQPGLSGRRMNLRYTQPWAADCRL